MSPHDNAQADGWRHAEGWWILDQSKGTCPKRRERAIYCRQQCASVFLLWPAPSSHGTHGTGVSLSVTEDDTCWPLPGRLGCRFGHQNGHRSCPRRLDQMFDM